MNEITVKHNFLRIPSRKLQQISKLIFGKELSQAEDILNFTERKSARSLLKLLKSAKAAAKEQNLNPEKLYVKSVLTNQGPSLKRYRILHRGRSTRVLKRMSHLILTLAEAESKQQNQKNRDKQTSKRSLNGSKS